jgi:TRAP-type C4-dicarboxylate transport system permease small subunit
MGPRYQVVEKAIMRLADALGAFAMVLMLLMALHVFASVANRWFIGRELPATLELTQFYYMVALTFLPLAYVERGRAHVRADLLSQLFPPRMSAVAETITQLAMAAFLMFVTWRTLVNAIERTREVEIVLTGLGHFEVWPARWLVPAGLAVAACYALLRAAEASIGIVAPRRREPAGGI